MKKEIVLKFKEGKSSALKIIFDQYFEPLVRYSCYYLGDTTEPGFENFDIKMSTISFGMGVWFR